MSVTQVIDEIQNLPREEQEVVIAFVKKLQSEISRESESKTVRYMDPVRAKAVGEKVFTDHSELFRKLAQ
jgi:hypothetical protein